MHAIGRAAIILAGAGLLTAACAARAADTISDAADPRIRVVPYTADEVYRLKGYTGYQIDLEFEAGESFVGLGAGDLDSIAFAAQDNHLFLKPRAPVVRTNLTVLTNRRTYQFDYNSTDHHPEPESGEVIYALRFQYAPPLVERHAERNEQQLAQGTAARWRNRNYLYCGSRELKPEAAFDDGVQTRLRFGARQELPAIFLRNGDGSESLVNFSVDAGEVVVQRVARQFVLRRGKLHGCILNQGFSGSGEQLTTGTVSSEVVRRTRRQNR